MSKFIAAFGIASGLYHGVLVGAALFGMAATCSTDAEMCSKARGMATSSGVAVAGCVALSGLAIRRQLG